MSMNCALARKKLTDAVQAASSTAVERGVGVVKTGYLTSVTSRERHIGGLGLSMGLDAVAHYPEAALDLLLSKVTGAPRSTSMVNPLTAAGPVLKAGVRGAKDALAAIKAGIDPETVPTGFDLNQASARNGILATAQRYVGTIVSASNKPFFEMAQTASLIKRAQMLAEREGLSGAAAKKRIAVLLDKPTDDMALGSLADAAHATLADDNVVAQAVTGVKSALRKGMTADVDAPVSVEDRAKAQALQEGHRGDAVHHRVQQLMQDPQAITVTDQPPLSVKASRAGSKALSGLAYGASELLAPFPKIESNIAGRVIDYSPAGFVKVAIQALRADGDAKAGILARGLARAGVGTTAGFAAGYYLASKGLISSPDAKGDGQQPLALKVGRDYYDLKTFAPVSLLPVLGASYFFDHQKHPDDVAANALRATGRELGAGLQHGVLNGVATANDAVHGTADAARKLIGNLNPVPSIVRQVAKGTDVERNTRDPNPLRAAGKDALATIPGARRALPAKQDPFGREIPHAGGLADALLDPAYHTRVPAGTADSMAVGLNAIPKIQPRQVQLGGVKHLLSDTDRAAISKQFGADAATAFEQLARDPSFTSLPPDQQRKVALSVLASRRHAQLDSVRASIFSKQ